LTILREHCDAIGRDPASLRLTWFGRLAVASSEAEAEALSDGVWTKNNALIGTPAQVSEQLHQFIELGVDYFMVEALGVSQPDLLEMVLGEVLSPVTRGR
jgi:alkanesulfonate monooxygenase SsuD/methylene tetrahydromethanopterin reductase-like flavin-dependent oxidoreductase (luciferase family)